jgi:Ca-activated chloride channel family protein
VRRRIGLAAVLAAAALLLSGCVGTGSGGTSGSSNSSTANGANVLRVLAGSEVQDMVPILTQAEKAIGVKVEMSYIGTIDGTEDVASGETTGKFDATWFPNNRYLALLPGAATATSTSVKIMSSPVVFGLKPAIAHALGWDTNPPTWAGIAQAAAAASSLTA